MSERLSPPTERVVKVLELLGADPHVEWSLSAISRRLDITSATTLAIMNQLTRAGFVARSDRKTYTIGPALLALGRSAGERFPDIRTITHELTTLAEELGCSIAIAYADGDEIVASDRVGNLPADDLLSDFSTARIPLAFPYGVLFVAWARGDVIDEWVARPRLPTPPANVPALLTHIRCCGYAIYTAPFVSGLFLADYMHRILRRVPKSQRDRIAHITELLVQHDPSSIFLTEVDRTEHYGVGQITAPLFDHSGQPRYVAAVAVRDPTITGQRVVDIAHRLRDETRRITTMLGGVVPALAEVRN